MCAKHTRVCVGSIAPSRHCHLEAHRRARWVAVLRPKQSLPQLTDTCCGCEAETHVCASEARKSHFITKFSWAAGKKLRLKRETGRAHRPDYHHFDCGNHWHGHCQAGTSLLVSFLFSSRIVSCKHQQCSTPQPLVYLVSAILAPGFLGSGGSWTESFSRSCSPWTSLW